MSSKPHFIQGFDEEIEVYSSWVKHFALQSQLLCPRFFGVQSIQRRRALKLLLFP